MILKKYTTVALFLLTGPVFAAQTGGFLEAPAESITGIMGLVTIAIAYVGFHKVRRSDYSLHRKKEHDRIKQAVRTKQITEVAKAPARDENVYSSVFHNHNQQHLGNEKKENN